MKSVFRLVIRQSELIMYAVVFSLLAMLAFSLTIVDAAQIFLIVVSSSLLYMENEGVRLFIVLLFLGVALLMIQAYPFWITMLRLWILGFLSILLAMLRVLCEKE